MVEVHNSLRPANPKNCTSDQFSDNNAEKESFSQIIAAFRNLREANVTPAVITQISQENIGELENIRQILLENNVKYWQIQLMNPMGRAENHSETLKAIIPEQLPRVYNFIRDVQESGKIHCQASDNIGYFHHDEAKLRSVSSAQSQFWNGCPAGMQVIGIASNGDIKGCLSMPDSMIEGNVRESSLTEIWTNPVNFSYNRNFSIEDLSGPCKECSFGKICRGGCHSFTKSSANKIGENHHCMHQLCHAE